MLSPSARPGNVNGWSVLLVLLTLLLVSACGDDDSGPVAADPDVPDSALVPDFSVADVNDTSPRFGESVSPRGYIGQISAWYFGHAT